MKIKYHLLFLFILFFMLSSVSFSEEVSGTFNSKPNSKDQEVFVLAYRTAFEVGTGEKLDGNNEIEKIDKIKSMILAQERGYPENIKISKVSDNQYQVAANFIKNKSIRNNPKATKELVRMLGNPRIVVKISEINHGQEVLRSKVETSLENLFIKNGYRILNFPMDYLAKLEERKKSIEIRKTGEVKVSTSGAFNTVLVESLGYEYILDYSTLVLGSGNEKEALETAKEIGANIIIVGGSYTIPIELPPAVKAWKDQGYKKARAFVNLQAMLVSSQELVYSNTLEFEAMDFSNMGAGNKALVGGAEEMAKELVYEMLENIHARDIIFKQEN